MVMLAVDSTARPFECDIGEKPTILAGYRESIPRATRQRPATARSVCGMSMNAGKPASPRLCRLAVRDV
jgi:hypothetical protein